MKSIVLILSLIGIILIAVGYVKSNLQCPPSKIEYRYIEKTFDQQQDVQTPILSLSGYANMFNNESPWFDNKNFGNPKSIN